MKSDLTDITLVIDRSGSMSAIRDDAEGGINTFIREQAEEPGEALLTLVQFDTKYEFVHEGVPIGVVPHYKLVPRGATALLDAIGRAINETGARLAAMQETDRPGLVLFVVMTDGLENSSVEFTKSQIKEMIQHQESTYSWHFTFLGADQDAFAEGGGMGFAPGAIAGFDSSKMFDAYLVTSSKYTRMRKQSREGQTVENDFTEEERKQLESDS